MQFNLESTMAVVALIKKNGREVPHLVERIKKGDQFCFVVNQKKLGWHIARVDGRDNLFDYRAEILANGGRLPVDPATVKREAFEVEGV